MVDSTPVLERRANHIRRVIEWGTKLILGVVGIGLFRTEFLRIMALPRELNSELYLVLLSAATLLTAGWIFVANKEFDIMCDFFEPDKYRTGDQTYIGMAIAAALIILLYTARNPLWFGVSYSAYMLLSVLGWKRVVGEMDKAIKLRRLSLRNEPKQKRAIYEGAVDILHAYYLRQANLPRVYTSLVLGVVGLIFSILALTLGRTIFNTIAYLIFTVSILALELGLAFYWRLRLYTRVRPYVTAKYDFEDARHYRRAR